ncbi:MAG: hypothetical protein EKK48_28830 [Candidatus Melainabacteria bacterium]|jgi:hypothetical protein|nr:MAG: hypothetical protein EKK48_28830 [Candidatus Melainabacteria bacterium]
MTSHKIDGKWRGHYTYSDNPDRGSAFDASFTDSKGALSGEIVDDEWLGAAVLVGSFNYPTVRFTKQYTTLKVASIDYQGTMSDDGKTMSGKWVIYESELTMRGSWHAYRIDKQREKRTEKGRSEKEKLDSVF